MPHSAARPPVRWKGRASGMVAITKWQVDQVMAQSVLSAQLEAKDRRRQAAREAARPAINAARRLKRHLANACGNDCGRQVSATARRDFEIYEGPDWTERWEGPFCTKSLADLNSDRHDGSYDYDGSCYAAYFVHQRMWDAYLTRKDQTYYTTEAYAHILAPRPRVRAASMPTIRLRLCPTCFPAAS